MHQDRLFETPIHDPKKEQIILNMVVIVILTKIEVDETRQHDRIILYERKNKNKKSRFSESVMLTKEEAPLH